MRHFKRYFWRVAVGVGVALTLTWIRATLAHAETLEDFSAYVVTETPGQMLDFLGTVDPFLAWVFGIVVTLFIIRFLVRNANR